MIFKHVATRRAGCTLTVLALACCLSPVSAAERMPARSGSKMQPAAATAAVGELGPQARAAMTRSFVRKWGGYVQRVYGVEPRVWAQRMVSSFVTADPHNFRAALARDTFEGAMAALSGRGEQLQDAAVVDGFARVPAGRAGSAKAMAQAGTKALGSTTGDLVFTPVVPCRILDTRVTGGPIAAGATRSFLALAANPTSNFTSQGGSNTNCNVASVGASAVAINVTAVTPTAGGYATVYPFGASAPTAASLNYRVGTVVNNTVIVGVPNPLGINDFTIFTFAQADYVADIVGYFSPPQATQFDCVNTSVDSFTIPANSVNFYNNPACPTGYKATTPYCWTASTGVYHQGSGYNANAPGNATFCSWQNTTASSQTVFGGNVCCRVPGR